MLSLLKMHNTVMDPYTQMKYLKRMKISKIGIRFCKMRKKSMMKLTFQIAMVNNVLL